jgi:hypothetical protein
MIPLIIFGLVWFADRMTRAVGNIFKQPAGTVQPPPKPNSSEQAARLGQLIENEEIRLKESIVVKLEEEIKKLDAEAEKYNNPQSFVMASKLQRKANTLRGNLEATRRELEEERARHKQNQEKQAAEAQRDDPAAALQAQRIAEEEKAAAERQLRWESRTKIISQILTYVPRFHDAK